jgi:hypothetical protein
MNIKKFILRPRELIFFSLGTAALYGIAEHEKYLPKNDVLNLKPENTISIQGDCSALAPVFENAKGGEKLKVTVPEGCSIHFPALEAPQP